MLYKSDDGHIFDDETCSTIPLNHHHWEYANERYLNQLPFRDTELSKKEDATTLLDFIKENPIYDSVKKAKHYNSYIGIEVIELVKQMNFCRGNAVKYLTRAAFKGTELEDLKKAQYYINCEIERMENLNVNTKK